MKIRAQRLFPSDKFIGVFSGLRQVSALRGVCGGDGVKRVVCSERWECDGCLIEEGDFWGIISFLFTWFMGVLGDHDKDSIYYFG